jgi:hypothetical protein
LLIAFVEKPLAMSSVVLGSFFVIAASIVLVDAQSVVKVDLGSSCLGPGYTCTGDNDFVTAIRYKTVNNVQGDGLSALTAVQMKCSSGTLISGEALRGVTAKGEWRPWQKCSGANIVKGFIVESQCGASPDNMKVKCAEDHDKPTTENWGKWGNWGFCPEGEYVYGFRTTLPFPGKKKEQAVVEALLDPPGLLSSIDIFCKPLGEQPAHTRLWAVLAGGPFASGPSAVARVAAAGLLTSLVMIAGFVTALRRVWAWKESSNRFTTTLMSTEAFE